MNDKWQKIYESNKKLEDLKQQQEARKVSQEPIVEQPKTTQEELQVIDFRVWVTQEQKMKIRDFLIQNNIKYGKVD